MNLLFHCCCGPCAIAPVESLCGEGISPTLFWYNPNIHPSTEYKSRRDSLLAFAGLKNLPLETADEYGLYSFIRDISGETEPRKRCEVCYRTRLERTAARVAELRFDAFGTSLLISLTKGMTLYAVLGMRFRNGMAWNFSTRIFGPCLGKAKPGPAPLGCTCRNIAAAFSARQTGPLQKRMRKNISE